MTPNEDLGHLLQHVTSLLAKQSDQVLQEQLGIGYSQLKLLLTLHSRPQLKQRDIAIELGQTEASISRQVKLMLRQGMLQVTVNPKNRREHLTTVTVKGLKLTDASLQALEKFQAPLFSAVGERQRQQLREILNDLHTRICQLDNHAVHHSTE